MQGYDDTCAWLRGPLLAVPEVRIKDDTGQGCQDQLPMLIDLIFFES